MKQLDFKQPKYIIPILVLPFILLLGYLVSGMLSDDKVETKSIVLGDINTDIPDAHLEKRQTQTKFGALKEAFTKSSDFSSIQSIEKDDVTNELDGSGSLYTSEEMRLIDSLNFASSLKQQDIIQQRDDFNNQTNTPDFDNSSDVVTTPAKSKMQEEMELFKAQMAYMDSLQNPQPKERVIKPRLAAEPPIEMIKLDNAEQSFFNSIGESNISSPITAILDESLKVVKGSRIKIRLMDDVVLDAIKISKGTYIYGVVSNFTNQRVIINISSIMINNKHVNVDLSIYDIDGMEGFYVPNSKFRDLTKDIGGKMGSQSYSSQGEDDNLAKMAYSAMQDVYSSSSKAISNVIRTNKAKLKYNSQVYLVNNKVKN